MRLVGSLDFWRTVTVDLFLTHLVWGELNEEEFLKNQEDKYYVYFTAKIKAEKSLWEFAAEHPEIGVATGKFVTVSTYLLI